jgi:hypothetical protein
MSSCAFCYKVHIDKKCPIIYNEIHFSTLATDEGTPTPSLKKSYIHSKQKVGLNTHFSQSYEQQVDSRVKDWIENATSSCGRLWFYKFQMKEETDHTDPFLKAVQHKVSIVAAFLCLEEKRKENDAIEREEIEAYKLIQKKKDERKSLQESMTPEEWDAFLQKEEDEYDPCYDSDY